MLRKLKVSKAVGDELTDREARKIADFYVAALEKSLSEKTSGVAQIYKDMEQARFRPPRGLRKRAVIVFSGGVGELIYALKSGGKIDPVTPFGDLGVDLAQAVLRSKALSKDTDSYVPENRGRATVYGLALHNTEISGSTLFLPDGALLPLRDLPIVGTLSGGMAAGATGEIMHRARQAHRPSCVRVECGGGLEDLRAMAAKISGALRRVRFPENQPLVLLVSGNFGKTLGNLVTDWGRSARNIIVIDEIRMKNAQFVSLGELRDGVVPVSFYGVTFDERKK